MQIHDGFIVSVFNYCDRWCEVCPLTSHCRLFADLARADAQGDSHMSAVFASVPEVRTQERRTWFARLFGGISDAADATSWESPRPTMASDHKAICERALAYAIWVHEWLQESHGSHEASRPSDPVAIVSWYASLNSSKIHRALTGLAEFDGDREFPPDHEGSAKVALIGLDRSLEAWQRIASEHRVGESVAPACIEELKWIKARLEAAIPYAHAFVRPGFDEPEAIKELLDVEGV